MFSSIEDSRKKSPEGGSNTRPPALQAYALPLSYQDTECIIYPVDILTITVQGTRRVSRPCFIHHTMPNMKPEDNKKPEASKEEKDEKKDEKKEKKEEKKPVPIPAETEIKNNAVLIDRAVSTLEPRFTHRVLRTLTALYKRVNVAVLRTAIENIYLKGSYSSTFEFYPQSTYYLDCAVKQTLLGWLPPPPSEDGVAMELDAVSRPHPIDPAPEVEMYLRLLILHHLLSSEQTHEQALDLANETAVKMQQLNRRSLDAIAGKIWYAVERAYDLVGELSDARRYPF